MKGITSNIGDWLSHPFDSEGSAWNWFLFAGLMLVISFAWSRIIKALASV